MDEIYKKKKNLSFCLKVKIKCSLLTLFDELKTLIQCPVFNCVKHIFIMNILMYVKSVLIIFQDLFSLYVLSLLNFCIQTQNKQVSGNVNYFITVSKKLIFNSLRISNFNIYYDQLMTTEHFLKI
ncbi:UNVERIFIED_CONTAM: hypothetical protein NCL1_31674 [Trichonephila clavipes]